MFINTSEDLSKVFEHASSVAPVVSTSSTRSICFFSKAFGSVTEKTSAWVQSGRNVGSRIGRITWH